MAERVQTIQTIRQRVSVSRCHATRRNQVFADVGKSNKEEGDTEEDQGRERAWAEGLKWKNKSHWDLFFIMELVFTLETF